MADRAGATAQSKTLLRMLVSHGPFLFSLRHVQNVRVVQVQKELTF